MCYIYDNVQWIINQSSPVHRNNVSWRNHSFYQHVYTSFKRDLYTLNVSNDWARYDTLTLACVRACVRIYSHIYIYRVCKVGILETPYHVLTPWRHTVQNGVTTFRRVFLLTTSVYIHIFLIQWKRTCCHWSTTPM